MRAPTQFREQRGLHLRLVATAREVTLGGFESKEELARTPPERREGFAVVGLGRLTLAVVGLGRLTLGDVSPQPKPPPPAAATAAADDGAAEDRALG